MNDAKHTSICPQTKMKRWATISNDYLYRYDLGRQWDENKGLVIFICLNPSTADADNDDNTVKKCIGYARRWGYGGIVILNLFAYRATDPKELLDKPLPRIEGPSNSFYWQTYMNQPKTDLKVIAAWGNDGGLHNQSRRYAHFCPNMYALKVNKTGHPAHPLYLKNDLQPVPWPETSFNYYWSWGTKDGKYPELGQRKGQLCRVIVWARKKNSVLIEFQDGFQVVTSIHGLRKVKTEAS